MNTFEKCPDARITEIYHATENDTDMQKLFDIISNVWPRKNQLDNKLKPYYPFKDTVSHEDGNTLQGEVVLIPKSMRSVIKPDHLVPI